MCECVCVCVSAAARFGCFFAVVSVLVRCRRCLVAVLAFVVALLAFLLWSRCRCCVVALLVVAVASLCLFWLFFAVVASSALLSCSFVLSAALVAVALSASAACSVGCRSLCFVAPSCLCACVLALLSCLLCRVLPLCCSVVCVLPLFFLSALARCVRVAVPVVTCVVTLCCDRLHSVRNCPQKVCSMIEQWRLLVRFASKKTCVCVCVRAPSNSGACACALFPPKLYCSAPGS